MEKHPSKTKFYLPEEEHEDEPVGEESLVLKFPHLSNIPLNCQVFHRSNELALVLGGDEVLLASDTLQGAELRAKVAGEFMKVRFPKYGWAVVDRVLGADLSTRVLTEVKGLYDMGLFKSGQLMRERADQNVKPETIRSDHTFWWEASSIQYTPAIASAVNLMDDIARRLGVVLAPRYNLDSKTRAMLACFPGRDTRYVRHVDNPNANGRLVTAILYLNADWTSQDGGMLRLYPTTAREAYIDVMPKLDRMLFFWSDARNPHEVLPSKTTRYALTVWYFDATEKEAAMQRDKAEQVRTTTTAVHPRTESVSSTVRTSASSSGYGSSASSDSVASSFASMPSTSSLFGDELVPGGLRRHSETGSCFGIQGTSSLSPVPSEYDLATLEASLEDSSLTIQGSDV